MPGENIITSPGFFPVAELPPSGNGVTGVQWTSPLEHPDWDSQIAEQNHPARSFFHSAAWTNVLTDTYGYKPVYFVTKEAGTLHSVLPLMEVNSALTGRRAVALPFTDGCDPLCPDKESFRNLFRNAVEFGRMRGWKYLEFRGGQTFFDETPALFFYRHNLDLSKNENVLFRRLEGSVRRAIRKAEKEGVRVEISQERSAVKIFYALHCRTRKRHGLPPQPFSFFKNIYRYVLSRNLGIVAVARRKHVPVAASIFFRSGSHAIYKFGASDETFQQLRGNNLVMWEAIRLFAKEGAKMLDLGRTSAGNEGLRRFKLGWNAEEKPVGYFRYCLRREKFVEADDESSGWHNHVFRALPVFASRFIGKVLYRHWA